MKFTVRVEVVVDVMNGANAMAAVDGLFLQNALKHEITLIRAGEKI